jgi:hypothetical protein
MSIQIVEIAQPSVIDTVAVAQPSTVALVEIRQGPAGDAGGGTNSITSATTSDGTADLDLLNVDTVTATVTGTLTADHIHGNLAGNVYGHIRAGETLAKGDPVYVSGSHGSGSSLIPIVSKADASNAAKMPAVGIMDAAVANNASGHMVIVGTITELNTAGYTVNAELYVAAGGGFTATPPSARAQPVARVERANANNGAVIVKVNGLSASDATASTLVRRDAIGGADFAGTVNLATGVISDLRFEDYQAATGATFTYNGTSASDHRIALGAGTTGAALFGAADAAAARNAIRTKVVQAADLPSTTTASVDTDLSLTLQGGVDYLVRGSFDVVWTSSSLGVKLAINTSQPIDCVQASGCSIGIFSNAFTIGGVTLLTTTRSDFFSTTGVATYRKVFFEVSLKLTATGTFKITFGQVAAGSPASVFKAGSFLTSEIL